MAMHAPMPATVYNEIWNSRERRLIQDPTPSKIEQCNAGETDIT